MKNQKKLQLLLLIVVLLFFLSGCTTPTDAEGNILLITSDTTLQMMMDTESWWTAFFVFPLAQLINYLTPILGDNYGVAISIAVVTASVNIIVLLLTLRSNIATQKMQIIQPELNKIQKKYEGKTDQASQMKQGQEMQALYKKHGINPFGAILSMFVQFPIIIAIYHAVQRAEAVATGSFMGLSLQVSPMDGVMAGEFAYAVLLIIMTVFQIFSAKLPQILAARKAKAQAQAEGRKYVKQPTPGGPMMNMLIFMIPVIAVGLPAAMTIYWTISSIVMIAKTLAVQAILAKQSNV